MSEERRSLAKSVRDSIVSTVKGVGENTDAVVDTVSGSLVNAVKRTGTMGAARTVAISEVESGVVTNCPWLSFRADHAHRL